MRHTSNKPMHCEPFLRRAWGSGSGSKDSALSWVHLLALHYALGSPLLALNSKPQMSGDRNRSRMEGGVEGKPMTLSDGFRLRSLLNVPVVQGLEFRWSVRSKGMNADSNLSIKTLSKFFSISPFWVVVKIMTPFRVP